MSNIRKFNNSGRSRNKSSTCVLMLTLVIFITIILFGLIYLIYSGNQNQKNQFEPHPNHRSGAVNDRGIAMSQLVFEKKTSDKFHRENVIAVPDNLIELTSKSGVQFSVNQDVISNKFAASSKSNFPVMIKQLFDLGVQNPKLLLEKLNNEDPFNINNVSPDTFECPNQKENEAVDYPSLASKSSIDNFKAGNTDSFIFYQHLRKAGGTGFCDLASRNLPKRTVPSYYCMPDNRGSLSSPPWSNPEYLLNNIKQNNYRIVANEWDVFHEDQTLLPNVVLATTIRHPIDRWYSQYRFEHLEHRDGSKQDASRLSMIKWYNNEKMYTMGTNYYIKTFIGLPDLNPPRNLGDFYWSYHKYQKMSITWDLFQQSLTNFRKFHVILVTELLDSSPNYIRDLLGWTSPPKKVLPHETQAIRDGKKSITAQEVTPVNDYNFMLEENVLDVLFFHIAKRIYLERYSCWKASTLIS